jgi:hypothetical protein
MQSLLVIHLEKVRRRVREGESMLKIVVGHRCLWYFLGRETRNSAHVFSAARQRDEHVVNTLVKQHAPHIKVIMKDGHNLLILAFSHMPSKGADLFPGDERGYAFPIVTLFDHPFWV